MLTKTFDLEWGDGGIRTHKATDVLSDWTMDALRFLYDKYFWEAGMIDWINHNHTVIKMIDDWDSLEELAVRSAWPEPPEPEP